MNIQNQNQIVEYDDESSVKFVKNGLVLDVSGSGNKIIIGKNVTLDNLVIQINSNNNYIHIGNDCRLTGKIIMKIANNNQIKFGSGTSIGMASLICGEGKSITFGNDCMVAWGVEIRTTDSHAIFDINSTERVNSAEDIVIGNHVWIGAHATILKGSCIDDGSVVALRSLVSGKFNEKNIVLAGTPAKIIKRGVYWERPLLG